MQLFRRIVKVINIVSQSSQIRPIALLKINVVYHVMMDVDVYIFIQHRLEQKKSVYAGVKVIEVITSSTDIEVKKGSDKN